MMNNKKGLAFMPVIAFILLGMLAIYVVLYIPVPAFTKIRVTINYFLVSALWIIVQITFVYGYFQLAKYIIIGYSQYKKYLLKINMFTERLILRHT